ncbi:Hypothetical predicted protein [Mytilus galloprovincialis]|uniref:CARD domain-containing protein n=1 Tax=Mytilus galloprovincialis TaxID=29158 RepID=A0A8B6DYM9_MYTGA|nr:Hypothetical predicted protein [Mytilus galloprovincialis]
MSLHFSNHCGENIVIQNGEAEWKTVYSGGLCFSERPLGRDPLQIIISGSSHITLGFLEKNPDGINIRDVLQQMKITNDIRVHKSTFNISMKTSKNGREVVLDNDDNPKERFPIENGSAWLAVYIQFGSATVYLMSSNAKFLQYSGENIKLTEKDKKASLIDENPAALGYIDRPLYSGEAITVRVNPVTDPNKIKTCSVPSRYYIKIGFYEEKSKSFKDNFSSLLTVTGEKRNNIWKPIFFLEKSKSQGNIQINLSESGSFSFSSESGESGNFDIPNHGKANGVMCVFELFRVRVKLLKVSRYPAYDYASPATISPRDLAAITWPIDTASISSPISLNETLNINQTSLFDFNTGLQIFKSNETSSENGDCETKTKVIDDGDIKSLNDHSENGVNFVVDEQTQPKFLGLFNDLHCNLINGETRVKENPGHEHNNINRNPDNNNISQESILTTDDNLTSSCNFPAIENDTENTIKQSPIRNACACEVSKRLTRQNTELKTIIEKLQTENDKLRSENLKLNFKIRNQSEKSKLQLTFENQDTQTLDGNLISKNTQNNSSSETSKLSTTIQRYFVRFVHDLEIPDLCDHLYQNGQITIQDFDDLHHLVKQNKREANRWLLTLVRKRAICYDTFKAALVATKQEGLVQLL